MVHFTWRSMQPARYTLILATALALGACASIPDELAGEYGGPSPRAASPADVGAEVRWGGRLLAVTPEAKRSCFEILSRPLSRIARPVADGGGSGQRFLACRRGFVDPAAYPAGADITIVGRLSAFETRMVGDYDYRYPVVRLRAAHQWPRRRALDPDPIPPPRWWYYEPFWYGHPYHRHR